MFNDLHQSLYAYAMIDGMTDKLGSVRPAPVTSGRTPLPIWKCWERATIAAPFSRRSRRVLFGLWGLIATAVIIGSLLPAASLPMANFDGFMLDLGISDKVQHFGAYLILAFVPAWSASRINRTTAVVPALLVIQGGFLELAQLLVPGRDSDVLDFLANTFGVFVGTMLGLWVRVLRVRRCRVQLC
jgi:hypothetical protein